MAWSLGRNNDREDLFGARRTDDYGKSKTIVEPVGDLQT